MKRFAAMLFFAPLLLAQTDTPRQLTVTAVRQWALPEATRIAVQVSGDFQYRSDRAHNPERVYFDVLNARPLIETRRAYTAAFTVGLVQRVRVAETAPGITRVVLELGAAVEISASKLTNPYRLMIELKPAPAEAPAASPPSPAATAAPAAGEAAAVVPPVLPPAAPAAPRMPTAVPKPAPGAVSQMTAEPSKSQTANPAPAPRAADIPKPARSSGAGDPSLIRTLGLKIERVVIDPGHGGHDQGTDGPHGILEKDLVLDVAKRVGALIEQKMGAEVVYTRSDDTFIPLEARTQLANEKKADLFLSIHANSSPVPRVAGVETFYLNITGSSKDALDVAARENASSDKSVFELADLIQKIARRDKAEESRQFAWAIQTPLFAVSKAGVPGAKNRGVKTAPFVVLIGANMPSVLAEIGFVSNTREETLLKKTDYRQKVAEALYKGISRYADSLSHFEVAQTPAVKPEAKAAAPAARNTTR